MRLLGIDYGDKRVGVAISDEGGQFAFPYAIIKNDKQLLSRVQDICTKEEVTKIVIGESNTYAGVPNPIMKKINKFKEALGKATGIPIVFEQEMLTSQEAKRSRVEGDERHIDDSAAALILQSYLDKNTRT